MASTFEKKFSLDQGIRNLWPNTSSVSKLVGEKGQTINVGELERKISIASGTALALYGVARGSVKGLALAVVGGDLVYRGTTGHCVLYETLGMNTATQEGIKVERVVTIEKSPEELYRFWRNFENLPRFMEHLESVKATGGTRSHWIAKAPAGMSVEWDAEIIEEHENELIAWSSLPGADIANTGKVRFGKATGGRGTEVKVILNYNPPAGKVGAAFAKLFGEEPTQQIQEDLRHFKQLMESGEIPTTKGQPSCRDN